MVVATQPGTFVRMSDMASSSAVATAEPPTSGFVASRPCTRCAGLQELTSSALGFARYRCDTCEMVVGVDREAEPLEFLIDRGLPRAYTKDVFGERLQLAELRGDQLVHSDR